KPSNQSQLCQSPLGYAEPHLFGPNFVSTEDYVLVLAEGRPPPTIAWVLANKTHVSDSSAGNNDVRVEPDGTLIIKEATVYDRGLYTCMAKNPAGTDTLVVKLQVVAAPPAILEEKRERVEGTMGENLKLPCTVTGNPRPAVHWVLFDGTVVKPLQFVNGKLFLFANGTLHLSTVAPADSGSYECIATSSTGSDRRVVTLKHNRRRSDTDESQRHHETSQD
uniref:Immunoglobulin superfamily member 10 n=1 Tax=Strix occidentalis caurina TaxID=311401 RepID=A0A8D0EVB1_STROC